MSWYSILAIYLLFWTVSLFVVLPFGAGTSEEAGEELVPGQAESAPRVFRPKQVVLWTTIVSTVSFAIFYLNWEMDWITREHVYAVIERIFGV